MREIKFRAWDGKKFGYLQIQANLVSWPSNIWMEQNNFDEGVRFVGVVSWEQFTGLRDKNGKEIYEGDIVRSQAKGFGKTFQVKWFDGCARFELEDYVPWGMTFDLPHLLEVVGNIHENPELIK